MRPRDGIGKARRTCERGLFALAFVLLGAWTGVEVAGRVARAGALRELAAQIQDVQPGTTLRQRAALSGLVGRIEMPRLELDAVIFEGASDGDLLLGAGHLSATALPDEPGNVVLAGHRDSHFRPLKDVREGDLIRLTTAVGSFDYVVESTATVSPDAVEVLADTGEPLLTLITCYPFRHVGPAPERFIVRARPAVAPAA